MLYGWIFIRTECGVYRGQWRNGLGKPNNYTDYYRGYKGSDWVSGCETAAQRLHCYAKNEYAKWNFPQNVERRAGCPGFTSDKSQEWFL